MRNYPVELKKFTQKTVIGKEFIGPYWDSATIFSEVYLWAITNKDKLEGNIFGFFYDNPKDTKPEECRSFAAITIKEGAEIEIPKGFIKKTIPSMDIAVVTYKGAYYAAEKYKAYGALRNWLEENTEYLNNESLLIEEYLNTPVDTKEEDLLTGIYMPVIKK